MTTVSFPLKRGERLLWSGVPRQGLVLQPSDVLFIPFSLLWGGFAIFWELGVIRSGAPLLFLLWGVPFVAFGLFLIVGRFFWDSWLRAHTAYGVTTERVLIATSRPVASLASFQLKSLPIVELEQRPDGSGTVIFGRSSRYPTWMTGGGWPGMPRPAMFAMIPNAKAVFEIVEDARGMVRGGGA